MSQRLRFYGIQFSTVGLLWLTLLIYFPPYARAFVGDDYVQLDYILQFVARPFTAFQLFNPFTLTWYYRPLQNLWFLANRLTFGYEPFGYYWLGLLLHALVVALVYRVARQMGLRPSFALAAAALFAVHKHYVDVVAWISAIAIVMAGFFTLATFSAYLQYLQTRRLRWLLFTFAAFFLTLLSHEEAILLPPLLLLWRMMGQRQPQRTPKMRGKKQISPTPHFQRPTRPEWLTFALMFLLIALFIGVQFARPNLTISLADAPAGGWWAHLSINQLTRFTAETAAKFLPIPNVQPFLVHFSYPVSFLTIVLLGCWFWRGGRVARLGIAWALLHLGFIYWALWTQKPELYAGRHIYNAWIGLALGAADTLGRRKKEEGRRERGERWLAPLSALLIGAVVVSGIIGTRQIQADWLAKAQEDARARQQLLALLPHIDDDTHLFAYRFPITPNFLRSVTQAWYGRERPLRQPFGPLRFLQEHGQATNQFYVFDWDANGRLHNLTPEFQQHEQATLLWEQEPVATVVRENGDKIRDDVQKQTLTPLGPGANRRLGIQVVPLEENTWVSLAYAITVPQDGALATAVIALPENGDDNGRARFRVRVIDGDGEAVVWETAVDASATAWQEAHIPLAAYANRVVILHLETSGSTPGAWANPRLVTDNRP